MDQPLWRTLLTFLIHLLLPLLPAPYSVQPTHPPLWISSLLTPNFQAVLEHTHPSFIPRPREKKRKGKHHYTQPFFLRKEMWEKKKSKIVKSGHRDFSNQAPFLPASFFPISLLFLPSLLSIFSSWQGLKRDMGGSSWWVARAFPTQEKGTCIRFTHILEKRYFIFFSWGKSVVFLPFFIAFGILMIATPLPPWPYSAKVPASPQETFGGGWVWKEEKEEEVAVSEKKGGSQKKPRGGSQKEEERHLFSLSPSPLSFFLSSCQPFLLLIRLLSLERTFCLYSSRVAHAVTRTHKRLCQRCKVWRFGLLRTQRNECTVFDANKLWDGGLTHLCDLQNLFLGNRGGRDTSNFLSALSSWDQKSIAYF